MQLLCKPLHRGGCAPLLQQGLFGLISGLGGEIPELLSLRPHEDNDWRQRAPIKQSPVCPVTRD